MKTTTSAFAKNKNTDFEAWARLLICRKVPDGYKQLVNSEVVHDGAEILKRGDAFEVRIRERGGVSGHREIFVTPFPNEQVQTARSCRASRGFAA